MSMLLIIIICLDLQCLECLLDGLDEFGFVVEVLEVELLCVQVVGYDEILLGVVIMNFIVCCCEESSGKEYILILVYFEDVVGEGKVLIFVLVGIVLLGLIIGQIIDWLVLSGKMLKLILLEIEYQLEVVGDYVC